MDVEEGGECLGGWEGSWSSFVVGRTEFGT